MLLTVKDLDDRLFELMIGRLNNEIRPDLVNSVELKKWRFVLMSQECLLENMFIWMFL
jgi:hypothetical protein